MFDVETFVQYLDSHANAVPGKDCAKHIREALEAAGLESKSRPGVAKDYGPFLESLGFRVVSQFAPTEVGDIVVIQPTPAAAKNGFSADAGHIAAYDGKNWVSDFIQDHAPNDYNGGQYRKNRPPATFYRYYGPTVPRPTRRRIKPICPHCTSELKFEQRRNGPKADDPVTCYFHGFIGTRAQVDLAVAKRAQTHICEEIKVEIA